MSRYDRRYPDRCVARVSETNRATAARYLADRRLSGIRESSHQNAMLTVMQLDASLGGTPFQMIPQEAMRAHLQAFASTHRPATTHQHFIQIRTFLKWLHGGILPATLAPVLKRHGGSRIEDMKAHKPITPEEFRALLAACDATHADEDPSKPIRRRAILWALWDTGFRMSELLSLRIGDIVFDESGGARITLRPEAHDLKTGPRSIYVVECAGPIRMWLAVHPRGRDVGAPLWPTHRSNVSPMIYTGVNQILDRCARIAGTRHIHARSCSGTRARRERPSSAGTRPSSERTSVGARRARCPRTTFT
jgi:integrase